MDLPDQKGRFHFGRNWLDFLRLLTEHQIKEAERSLKSILDVERLDGKRFVDVGCGSGLFSLAARRLGAEVVSFDCDPESVVCARELRRRHSPDDPRWNVLSGDVLNETFLREIGVFDVVYAWGVLHHTGDLRRALANAGTLVRNGGTLCVAVYNHQGVKTEIWKGIKRTYNRMPWALRFAVLEPAFLILWAPIFLRDLMRLRPLDTWTKYGRRRGMSAWTDVVDWVGGYPFEAAKPTEVSEFYRTTGFRQDRIITVGRRLGCNEFVFTRERGNGTD